jgi:hypothetical protein
MAISQEDGGDSNCSGSVRYRSAELSTIALVVHLPTHAPIATLVGRFNTDLHQSPCGQAAAEAVERAAFDEPADDRSRRDTATVDLSVVGSFVLPSGSVSCGAPPNVGGRRRRLGRCPLLNALKSLNSFRASPLTNRLNPDSIRLSNYRIATFASYPSPRREIRHVAACRGRMPVPVNFLRKQVNGGERRFQPPAVIAAGYGPARPSARAIPAPKGCSTAGQPARPRSSGE